MSEVILPPSRRYSTVGNVSVFLAGSIDMGYAVDWQAELIKQFEPTKNVTLYNPRRDDWDSSWTQTLDSPQFVEQVNWELDFMDHADIVFMYISGTSKAPISLLEFGRIMALYPDKLVLCVEDGFYRRGNIEVMCNRQCIELHSDLKGAIYALCDRIERVQPIY